MVWFWASPARLTFLCMDVEGVWVDFMTSCSRQSVRRGLRHIYSAFFVVQGRSIHEVPRSPYSHLGGPRPPHQVAWIIKLTRAPHFPPFTWLRCGLTIHIVRQWSFWIVWCWWGWRVTYILCLDGMYKINKYIAMWGVFFGGVKSAVGELCQWSPSLLDDLFVVQVRLLDDNWRSALLDQTLEEHEILISTCLANPIGPPTHRREHPCLSLSL